MTDVSRGRNREKLKTGTRNDMYQVPKVRSYGSDSEHLKDLYSSVERHHFEFLLGAERKAESLRLLKAYATDFLSQVSHKQKFKFTAVERVLAQSIALVPNFDPREASLAFEDMAKYANNLLEQPWRKEFHRLKTTSGFFMHNILANLMSPQQILMLLGYVGTDDHTFELALFPVSSTLVAVSRDCYVASQECQILSQIVDRVLSEISEYPLTCREVYAVRTSLIGDTTTTAQHLTHQIRLRYSNSNVCNYSNGSAVTAVARTSLALIRSKVRKDFDPDTVNVRGSGILEKSKHSLVMSNNPQEEPIYQNEVDKGSPAPTKYYLAADTYYKTSSSSSPELTMVQAQAQWSCPHCTFENVYLAKICEMCSKSKDFVLED